MLDSHTPRDWIGTCQRGPSDTFRSGYKFAAKEVTDTGCNLGAVRFQRKVPGIKQVYFCLWQILPITALCGRSARRLQVVVMPVEGSCHCGNVRIELPSLPAWVADCNCSLCRRTAWRTAYYPPADVHISGETVAYVWGDHMIGIHHCPMCGCGTHWQTLGEDFGKMGINARLLDNFNESTVEVRKFNNAT